MTSPSPFRFLFCLTLFFCTAGIASAQISTKELKDMQTQVRDLVEQAIPATVSLRADGGAGSGVIVNKEGTILSAQHVTGLASEMNVVFPDGKTVTAKVLGGNVGRDISMLQIEDEAPEGGWPFVKIGDSDEIEVATIVVALGHPGGYDVRRTPPVRIGRAYIVNPKRHIVSDCTLIGGDSGGPLFNLKGELVGIHSSIGQNLGQNNHVPVNVATDNWDRMVDGETWGRDFNDNPDTPVMGAQLDQESNDGVGVIFVVPNSPAEKAGLQAEDKIIRFGGRRVDTYIQLTRILGTKKPGDEVRVVVQRGDDEETLTIKLARRGDLYNRPGQPGEDDAEPEGGESPKTPKADESAGGDNAPSVYLGAVIGSQGDIISVVEVVEKSPAAKAGLKAGDRIMAVGNTAITSYDQLAGIVRAKKAGDKLTFKIKRGKETKNVPVTLGGGGTSAKPAPEKPEAGAKRPERPEFEPDPDAESTPAAKPAYLGVILDDDSGKLVVIEPVEGYAAATAGIQGDDVITHADNKPVTTVPELAAILKNKSAGQNMALKVVRGDETKTIRVKLGVKGEPAEAPAPEAEAPRRPGGSSAPEKKADPEATPKSATPAPEAPAKKADEAKSPQSDTKPEAIAPEADPDPSAEPGYLGAIFSVEGDEVSVLEVLPGTSAAKAGLKAGDILLGIGSEDVDTIAALAKRIGAAKAGDKIVLRLKRGDETLKLGVTLGTRP